MELIRRRWRFKEILAKKAYNEYIQDKEHVHMNATRWVTLTEFAYYLGKAGHCDVRESEEGLVLRYIDRDPEREAKQAAMREREKEELEQREIERRRLLRTVKAMGEASNENQAKEEAPTQPSTPSGPISFSFNAPSLPTSSASAPPSQLSNKGSETENSIFGTSTTNSSDSNIGQNASSTNDKKRIRDEGIDSDAPDAKKSKLVEISTPAPSTSASTTSNSKLSAIAPVSKLLSSSTAPPTSNLHSHLSTSHSSSNTTNSSSSASTSSLDSIMIEQEKKREREGRKDYWLHPNIVVKILNKQVGGGQYYGQKGVIKAVHETYTAEIRLDSGTVLKIDQDDLETVLPALGANVVIVNGAYRGETATLKSIDKENFCANVSILAGPARGRIVSKAYEDICKLL